MQQSTVRQRTDRRSALEGAPSAHGRLIATLGVGIVALGALFLPELRSAVEVWNASTAYSHCFLVLPMALYLLWDRREALTRATPTPELGWALLGIPIAAAWLVAERLGIMEGRQLTAITGFQLLFLVVLGRRLYWMLSGALLYLFFLVPFGAFLTPALQRFTADFSVIGLNVLGIPNYSDGFIIDTSAGTFFVAEACAGLRFLIAAVAFGVFYALLNYRSSVRRLLFMAASFVVPVIANGFRALGIVVLGQILGSAEAAAADHVIYGWLFFSIIMLLLVVAGHAFREDVHAPAVSATPKVPRQPGLAPYWGAIAVLITVGIGPAIAAMIDARAVEVPLVGLPTFKTPAGCSREDPATPPATGVRFALSCGVHRFDVTVAVFPARSTASALVTQRRQITQEIGAEDASVSPLETAEAGQGAWTLVQTTEPTRTTAFASWVDGAPVRSGLDSRIAQARDSLLGGDHAPVLITLTIPEPARSSVAERRAVVADLRGFVNAQTDLDGQMQRLSTVR